MDKEKPYYKEFNMPIYLQDRNEWSAIITQRIHSDRGPILEHYRDVIAWIYPSTRKYINQEIAAFRPRDQKSHDVLAEIAEWNKKLDIRDAEGRPCVKEKILKEVEAERKRDNIPNFNKNSGSDVVGQKSVIGLMQQQPKVFSMESMSTENSSFTINSLNSSTSSSSSKEK